MIRTMHNNSFVNEEKAEKDEVREDQFLLTINFGNFNKKKKFYFIFDQESNCTSIFILNFPLLGHISLLKYGCLANFCSEHMASRLINCNSSLLMYNSNTMPNVFIYNVWFWWNCYSSAESMRAGEKKFHQLSQYSSITVVIFSSQQTRRLYN